MRTRLLLVGLAATLTGLVWPQPHQAGAQAGAGATETARGVVFEDLNSNGVREEGEPGVEDVSVSNGVAVTRTDAEGQYSLSVDDETILFITKPSGYMVPVNEVQLPQFYYLHYPNGTPLDLEYPGIAPTGPLPESVDFPLMEEEESDTFEALVFADPQTRNFDELDDFQEDVVAELVGSDAAFGLTVGDIVNDPLDLYPRHNEIVSTIGVPWWNLPGNHDINYDAPNDTYSTETYKRVFGPTDYSADYGQVHFVNMDNVDYFGEEQGGYRGFLNETQLEWLENDLAHVPQDRLIVIATHIPLQTDATASRGVNTVNVEDLLQVLEGRQHLYSVSGHDTSNSWQMYLGEEDGWTGEEPFHHQVLAEVRGGGWTTGPLDERGIHAADMADGNPNGYYTISFDGTDYRPRFKASSLPPDFQMRLTFEGGVRDRATCLRVRVDPRASRRRHGSTPSTGNRRSRRNRRSWPTSSTAASATTWRSVSTTECSSRWTTTPPASD